MASSPTLRHPARSPPGATYRAGCDREPLRCAGSAAREIHGTRAVADLFGRIRLGGFPAFLIWGGVHLAYLVGWGNRFEAVSRWIWTILARNRRERLISVVSLVSEDVAEEGLQQLRAAARERQAAARAG